MTQNIVPTRKAITLSGRVQGVGFRPFVWRLATSMGLTGNIRNTSAGVEIQIQGTSSALAQFMARLKAELPPLAMIRKLNFTDIRPLQDEKSFQILQSEAAPSQSVLVSPDIGVCADCLAETMTPDARRHGYAFTNCVNCGPRYTITRSIPYDRPVTSMACFPMCESCASEYADPSDRRFHAQPIACPVCGPQVWLVTREDLLNHTTRLSATNANEAVQRAARLLAQGQIVAVRGLGGFQLACDAKNTQAVSRLRELKSRPHKSLAVMTASVADARNFCALTPSAIKLLESPEKPIVLCEKAHASPISPLVSPDTGEVGIMLPYTPLHALLLASMKEAGQEWPVLVMTSGNPQGEPICLGNREALARLDKLADAWLLHNRDILVRVDDSVVSPGLAVRGKLTTPEMMIRRARGYTPTAIPLPGPAAAVLGMGGELKAAFCLTRSRDAFLSQHLGDLKNTATLDFFRETLTHLQTLLGAEPQLIVRDLHPDFLSSRLAEELGKSWGIPVISLQHHAAHGAAVLAENGVMEAALALCMDGSGLGENGVIQGGELILFEPRKATWERLGGLSAFPLPGGEAAIREPWRIAAGLDLLLGREPGNEKEARLQQLLARKLNCPDTSSAGRLFDATAAALGLCTAITYEGQAAIRLEQAARQAVSSSPATALAASGGMVSSAELYAATLQVFQRTRNAAQAALFFHGSLAASLAELAKTEADSRGITKVGLSGGCMQNALLVSLLARELSRRQLAPLFHKSAPPGDGGLALGQAWWGHLLRAQ